MVDRRNVVVWYTECCSVVHRRLLCGTQKAVVWYTVRRLLCGTQKVVVWYTEDCCVVHRRLLCGTQKVVVWYTEGCCVVHIML